eukprot:1144446-Pelagomonas_calceolata.AAC.1
MQYHPINITRGRASNKCRQKSNPTLLFVASGLTSSALTTTQVMSIYRNGNDYAYHEATYIKERPLSGPSRQLVGLKPTTPTP